MPTLIFADGASSGNPGPGGWGAILVTSKGEVLEMGGGHPSTTNNRMELTAVIRALGTVSNDAGGIEVLTDSVYVIRGITQWVFGWKRKGWKTAEGEDVANQDLWKELMRAVAGKKIIWKYVRGHAGIPGNERVDEIAVQFSRGAHPRLYRGSLLSYDVPIHDLPESFEIPESSQKSSNERRGPKPAAYSYLSLVGGVPMRHGTWTECEQRVKGRSGARFKKAMSQSDEEKILSSWGLKAEDLSSGS